MSKLTNK